MTRGSRSRSREPGSRPGLKSNLLRRCPLIVVEAPRRGAPKRSAAWIGRSSWRLDPGTRRPSPPSLAAAPAWLTFNIVDEVFPDPCGAPGVATSTPLGPTVDDLVTALSNIKGYDAAPSRT